MAVTKADKERLAKLKARYEKFLWRYEYWRDVRKPSARRTEMIRDTRPKFRQARDEYRTKLKQLNEKAKTPTKPWAPKVVKSGLVVSNEFGSIGPIVGWVGHYTYGPVDTSLQHALDLWESYHNYHKGLGWGGIAYHYGIARAGEIVLLRNPKLKGAHVGGYNTGRIGIVMHGGLKGESMSDAQYKSLVWLLENTRDVGCAVDLKSKVGKVHWDFNNTSCPGKFDSGYEKAAK